MSIPTSAMSKDLNGLKFVRTLFSIKQKNFVFCMLYGGHIGPKNSMLKLHTLSCLFVNFDFVCLFVVKISGFSSL
jgi:hypothetical protein